MQDRVDYEGEKGNRVDVERDEDSPMGMTLDAQRDSGRETR